MQYNIAATSEQRHSRPRASNAYERHMHGTHTTQKACPVAPVTLQQWTCTVNILRLRFLLLLLLRLRHMDFGYDNNKFLRIRLLYHLLSCCQSVSLLCPCMEVCLSVCPSFYDNDQQQYYYFRCYNSILWTYFSNLLLNFQRKHGLLRTILAI